MTPEEILQALDAADQDEARAGVAPGKSLAHQAAALIRQLQAERDGYAQAERDAQKEISRLQAEQDETLSMLHRVQEALGKLRHGIEIESIHDRDARAAMLGILSGSVPSDESVLAAFDVADAMAAERARRAKEGK